MIRALTFLILISTVTVAGCDFRPVEENTGQDAGVGPDAGKTRDECAPGKMSCKSSGVDHDVICRCEWVCDAATGVCVNGRPAPGPGAWTCDWISEYKYTCTRKGTKSMPPGGTDWYCTWSDKSQAWQCVKLVTPMPDGSPNWSCTVDNAKKAITCKRKGSVPVTPGNWDCKVIDGRAVCQKQGTHKGLPPGGKDWKCHRTTKMGKPTWFCVGHAAGSAAPGGDGWKCTVLQEGAVASWRCERPESAGDYPPGGGFWVCVKGAEFAGTRCEKVKDQPKPPPPFGGPCVPGTKMWCDANNYGSWGQATCLPNGKWKTVMANGKEILDCQALADGRRPDTVCSCYHFFFNAACCERPDCVVPSGTKGRLCGKSSGKLCDPCNPMNPECSGKGSQCVVTNAHETYCGTLCDVNADCPTGYTCLKVKMKVGSTRQCIPSDYSCYY